MADIYTRALAGESLAPADATRFTAFLNTYVATVENLVGQQSLELGYSELDDASALDLLAPVLKEMLDTEAGAAWWRDKGPHLYVEDFRRQVEEAMAKAESGGREFGAGEERHTVKDIISLRPEDGAVTGDREKAGDAPVPEPE